MADLEMDTSSFMLPSLTEQFKQLNASSEGIATQEKPEEVWTPEDLEGVIELPFDIGAMVSGFHGMELEDEELKKLSKLWTKPLNRLAGNVKNADLIVAASATAAIVFEKFLMYKLYLADKEKKRLRMAQAKADGRASVTIEGDEVSNATTRM